MINLVSHFTHDDSHHSEWLRQRKWFIKAREDKARRDEIEEKLEENTGAFASAVIIATEIQLKAFEAKLDKYETATVTALIENQKQLDAVNTRIESMLAKAHVMEDGRRVFKSENDSRVIDEFGSEVSRDELDYDLIGPDHPSAESYLDVIKNRHELEAEKEKLHEYQDKLDDTRDKVSEGNLSKEELDDMDAELLDLMPESVQEHVPAMAPVKPESTPAVAQQEPLIQSKIAPQISSLNM